MSIASRAFLLLLLPGILLIYYGIFKEPRHKLWFLLVISYLFYALGGLYFIPLLLGLSFLTYWLAMRKQSLLGILLNLIALGFFKYWDFGATSLNILFNMLHLTTAIPLLNLALPLGISFYIFKHIGYLIETKNNRYPATHDFLSFAVFSAFFPQISAGPISDYKQIASQFETLPNKLTPEQANEGLVFISMGLAKKVLIANVISSSLASEFTTVGIISGAPNAWYVVIAFAVQLYFDFSGYTDMALGIGKLFGINLPPNFDNPYLATNIGQFWERWHISLSTWFRYYLFSPFSRSLLRKRDARRKDLAQYVANLVTMTLIGLWHGAAWNYILWGFYHGLLLSLNAWGSRHGETKIPMFLRRAGLLIAVLFGWALFMNPDASYLKYILSQIIGLGGFGSFADLMVLARNAATPVLILGIVLAFSGFSEAANLLKIKATHRVWYTAAWGFLAALCILLMGQGVSFLYVQF